MNNREIRLLTDIIKQKYHYAKSPIVQYILLKNIFNIEVPLDRIKTLPSPKQTLFREVITTKQGTPKLSKQLKYRSNVPK